MSELEVREEPEGAGAVAERVHWQPLFNFAAVVTMCALVLAPASVLGTVVLAGGALWLIWQFAKDMPSMVAQEQVRPEVITIGSVVASLYVFEMVLDNAVLPLSLDVLADPLMTVAMGGLALLAAAIPTYAVRLWRFWQREML